MVLMVHNTVVLKYLRRAVLAGAEAVQWLKAVKGSATPRHILMMR